MATKELAANIGKEADFILNDAKGQPSLRFRVRIVDARQAYGRTEYQIEPVAGSGAAWKENDSLVIDK